MLRNFFTHNACISVIRLDMYNVRAHMLSRGDARTLLRRNFFPGQVKRGNRLMSRPSSQGVRKSDIIRIYAHMCMYM